MKVESNFEIRIQLDDTIKLNGRSIVLSAPQARQLNHEIERELKHAPVSPWRRASQPGAARTVTHGRKQKLKHRAMRARLIRAGFSKDIAGAKASEFVAGTFDGDVDRLKSESAGLISTPKQTTAPKKVQKAHTRRGRLSAEVAAKLTAALERGDSSEAIRKRLNVADVTIKHYAARLAQRQPAKA